MSDMPDIKTSSWEDLPEGFSPSEPLYVFTDIHSCIKAMKRLLSKRPPDTRLVFLGDAIDRGPDPLGVLRLLVQDQNNILLRGNHDAMTWYSQPEVESTYWYAINDWMDNGGMITREAFSNALSDGEECGVSVTTVPLVFEQYWNMAHNFWISGNILFVHAGMPIDADIEWLTMPTIEAATQNSTPFWWRHSNADELYIYPRLLENRKIYVVSGHTPMSDIFTLCPYGINLDRGYKLKMAAEMRPAADGKPAKVRFISTECDEI